MLLFDILKTTYTNSDVMKLCTCISPLPVVYKKVWHEEGIAWQMLYADQ